MGHSEIRNNIDKSSLSIYDNETSDGLHKIREAATRHSKKS